MVIDFRSDTVTRPTPAMLTAMQEAAVGDDVFGEDPAINELESYAADLFGKEAALFCPSGTMTNQIAIKCYTQPGDEVICDFLSHIYQYEGGGIAFNSGCQVRTLAGNGGRITAAQVLAAINPDDIHKAPTRLVSLENTANRGGGTCYDFEELKKIAAVCEEKNLGFHLDGARLFNALVAKNETTKQYGLLFDSISICLSKGLGAPVGSLLLGDAVFIQKARRLRKMLGGGMRQAGYLAAAGLYALKNHVNRLKEDHHNAKALAEVLQKLPFIEAITPPETNILLFNLKDAATTQLFIEKCKAVNILMIAMTPSQVRIVTHLDITPPMMEYTLTNFSNMQL